MTSNGITSDPQTFNVTPADPQPVISGMTPTSGAQGKSIALDIKGTGFEDAPVVDIANTSGSSMTVASYGSQRDTEVVASSPSTPAAPPKRERAPRNEPGEPGQACPWTGLGHPAQAETRRVSEQSGEQRWIFRRLVRFHMKEVQGEARPAVDLHQQVRDLDVRNQPIKSGAKSIRCWRNTVLFWLILSPAPANSTSGSSPAPVSAVVWLSAAANFRAGRRDTFGKR